MTQKPLYRSLDANLALLEEMFGRSDDFYTKHLMLAGIPCAIVMFTGLSSPEKLCRMALDMLDRDPAMLGGGEGLCDYLLTQSRVPAEPDAVEDRTALVELLSNGLSVLLIDGVRRGVAFSTQEMPQRSISTPMSEGNLRGPQEAFTELLRNNISLLRRQFRTGTLVAEISTAKTRAKTEYCLCYDSTLAPKETIDALRERLEELDAQSLLDRMAQMEQEGTTFMNKQKQDTRRRRFVAPIVVAIVMSVLMAGLIWLFLWAFEVDPAGAPPLPVLALFVAIPAAVVVGVVIALVQRVREIERGEEDDARNY